MRAPSPALHPRPSRAAPALPALVPFKNVKTRAKSRRPGRRMDRQTEAMAARALRAFPAELPAVEFSVGADRAAPL